MKKIIIVGKSASGKDYLMRELINEFNLKGGVKHTTRPIRAFERDGVTYHYTNNEIFDKNEFIVKQEFNVNGDIWKYGLTKGEFESSDVFIMTPHEISTLNYIDRNNSLILYIDIGISIRENRLYKRSDSNDSIKRRIDADEEDFKDFKNYDFITTDERFNVNDIYNEIKNNL